MSVESSTLAPLTCPFNHGAQPASSSENDPATGMLSHLTQKVVAAGKKIKEVAETIKEGIDIKNNVLGTPWTRLSPTDESDEEIIQRLGIKDTALTRHVLFFVDRETGLITERSIKGSFNALGFKMGDVKARAIKKAFAALGCYSAATAHKLMHTASTEMYYQSGQNVGELNEQVFKEKCDKYAPNGVFTPESILQMAADDKAKAEGNKSGICHFVKHIFVAIPAIIAKGELTLGATVCDDNGNITVAAMRSIHTSSEVFRLYAEKLAEQKADAVA